MKAAFMLDRRFTIAWAVIGTQAIVNEVTVHDPTFWTVIFFELLAVEVAAVFRDQPGDTLSEHLWTFQRGGWARSLLVVGLVGWICARFAQLGTGPDFGRYALTAGLGLWLIPHFILQGREG